MAFKSITMIFAFLAVSVLGGRLSAPRPYLSPNQLALKRFKLCTTFNQIKNTPEYELHAETMKRFSEMCSNPDVYKFQATFRG